MQEFEAHTFGAEFEVIFPRGAGDFAVVAARLTAITGLRVEAGRRGPSDNQTWRIVHDGSVQGRGRGHGGEVVSPVLRGADGFAQVEKICNALRSDIGAKVNSTCGFHVHVGAAGSSLEFFKNLVKLFVKFEPAIDAIHAPSRRADNNNYCRSHRNVNVARLDAAQSINDVANVAAGSNGRYSKLNLAAFARHSTVEFRQHAGTVEADKAINWIKTCIRMVIAAKEGKNGSTVRTVRAASFDHLDDKAKRTVEMVTRPEGATRAEIINGTDWGALSVNRQARLAGIVLTVVRERGTDRFFAVASGDATSEDTTDVPVSLATFAAIIAATADERAYLTRRAAAFAGRA